jgi:Zn-dependent peptidase ImmA (M78 family)/DNA-binding XRE family transcriptional regulator
MSGQASEHFEPSRLCIARDRAGMTQRELCERAGISVRALKGYESGETIPSRSAIAELARALGFSEEFFLAGAIDPLPLEAASFRALSKASARVRNRAVASGTFAVTLFYPFLKERFELPTVDVPDLREQTPDGAADALRAYWGLGQRPIPHIVSLLEARGVRVFSLSEDCDAIDAFSLWRDGTPFVFLNTRKTAERSIFDAAHELGHLVLHRHGVPQGHDAENAADRFASAFLLPEAAIRADAPANCTVATVSRLKGKWHASTAAIGRRLRDLEIMTAYSYTQFNKHLAQLGRRAEPSPLARETSVVLRKTLAALAEEGLDLKAIARALHLPLAELRALTFGLQAVDGGGQPSATARGALRLVE